MDGGIDGSERYQAALGRDPAEIAAVRIAMREMAERHGFGDRAGDLVLALDEVIANAQEHGTPPILIDAWVDGRVVVEVRDNGAGFEPHRVWARHPPDRFGTRGRGLWITRQLTDHVQVACGDLGTVVRIELSPDPHIGA
ncbi:MAG TPA: ATP-binding protein [Miltoncostaeaceae bacterium]|nr:ATP-binding protein [Miltoncostaeaceae bacterium]